MTILTKANTLKKLAKWISSTQPPPWAAPGEVEADLLSVCEFINTHQVAKGPASTSPEFCPYCGEKSLVAALGGFLERGAYRDHRERYDFEGPVSCWGCTNCCSQFASIGRSDSRCPRCGSPNIFVRVSEGGYACSNPDCGHCW